MQLVSLLGMIGKLFTDLFNEFDLRKRYLIKSIVQKLSQSQQDRQIKVSIVRCRIKQHNQKLDSNLQVIHIQFTRYNMNAAEMIKDIFISLLNAHMSIIAAYVFYLFRLKNSMLTQFVRQLKTKYMQYTFLFLYLKLLIKQQEAKN